MAAVDQAQLIKNPRTGRFVQQGSPTWKKLVREGVIERPANLTAKDLSQHAIEEFAELPPAPDGMYYVRNKQTGEVKTRRLPQRISTTRVTAEMHCKQMGIECSEANLNWVENKLSGGVAAKKKEIEREKRRERVARRKHAEEQAAGSKSLVKQVTDNLQFEYDDDEPLSEDETVGCQEPNYAAAHGAGGYDDEPGYDEPEPQPRYNRRQPSSQQRQPVQRPQQTRTRQPPQRYPVRR
jgi:hypothetical protein